MSYTFGTTLPGTIPDVRPVVTEALAAEGFGILTEIDVAATLKAKLGIDHAPYLILGACNPPLAARAIGADPHIGALLPCNVVLRETEEGVAVDVMDPQAVLSLTDQPAIAEVASEVRHKLERVVAKLGS